MALGPEEDGPAHHRPEAARLHQFDPPVQRGGQRTRHHGPEALQEVSRVVFCVVCL